MRCPVSDPIYHTEGHLDFIKPPRVGYSSNYKKLSDGDNEDKLPKTSCIIDHCPVIRPSNERSVERLRVLIVGFAYSTILYTRGITSYNSPISTTGTFLLSARLTYGDRLSGVPSRRLMTTFFRAYPAFFLALTILISARHSEDHPRRVTIIISLSNGHGT